MFKIINHEPTTEGLFDPAVCFWSFFAYMFVFGLDIRCTWYKGLWSFSFCVFH